MKKNTASQAVGAQLVSATDGSAVTSGTTTVYVTGDAGTQAAGSVGSGACTHEGNGYWTYAPAQAETNYDLVAFTFVNTAAVNATVQIYTSFPQTGDNYARLGAPAGASVSADVAAVKSDTAATLTDTAEIGAAGAGLTALATQASMDVVDGIVDNILIDTAEIGAAGAGLTALGDTRIANLDATVSSRLASASYTAPDNANIALIAADTNELQIDWANGGRLDLILDARASQASVDVVDGIVDSILIDTAEIGAAGAGLTALATQASVNTVDGIVDNILLDTAEIGVAGAGLTALATQALLTTVAGYLDTEIAAILVDTNELQADWTNGGRLDLLIDAIKAKSDLLPASPAAAGDVLTPWTTTMTEAYAADGAEFTPAQVLYMLWSLIAERSIVGTTLTAKSLDGATSAMTFTLDSATTPTTQTRAT